MSESNPDAFRTNRGGFRRDIQPSRVAVPPGACDTHMHIVGPLATYPLRETRSLQPPESTLDDYRNTMRISGIGRNVIVQPSFFAKDNTCTLESTQALGESARAVVVVDPDIDEKTLATMHSQGARGVRIQRVVAGGASIEDIETLAARIAPFGWHIQLYVDAQDIGELVSTIRRLPTAVVFDHMAHVGRASSMAHPGFNALLDLLSDGKAWVKLSNARFVPDAERARCLVAANPKQVVWGSDWPHVAYEEEVPGEGQLLDLLAEWIPDEAMRNDVLVANPGRLYFS